MFITHNLALPKVMPLIVVVALLACSGGKPGSAPAVPSSSASSFSELCVRESCETSAPVLSTTEPESMAATAGVSECTRGTAYRIQPSSEWSAVYVSPNGGGDGQSPIRPTSLDRLTPSDQLYVSFLPGTYRNPERLIENAGSRLRVVSPCWHSVTLEVEPEGLSFDGLEEIVFRGVAFRLSGAFGLKLGSGQTLRLHESVIDGQGDGSVGLIASSAKAIWLSDTVIRGVKTGAVLRSITTRMDGVLLDGILEQAIVIFGDAGQTRDSGPARSLVGAVFNHVRIGLGADEARGLDVVGAAVSAKKLYFPEYSGPLGTGIRLIDSVGYFENLSSSAPFAPMLLAQDSVVWVKESRVERAQIGLEAVGGTENPQEVPTELSAFEALLGGGSALLNGDVLFASNVFSATDPLVQREPFETAAAFEGRNESPSPFPLPVKVVSNDYAYEFPGDSKISPQLANGAKLADQTVLAVGPNAVLNGNVGAGIWLHDGASLSLFDVEISNTSSFTFVQNDKLSNGGHGLVSNQANAIVIDSSRFLSNDGAGLFAQLSSPNRPQELGQTRFSIFGRSAVEDNHLGGVWLQGQDGAGTARLSDTHFNNNRLFSIHGGNISVVGRNVLSESVQPGSLELSCKGDEDCSQSVTPVMSEFSLRLDYQFSSAPTLSLRDLSFEGESDPEVLLLDVGEALLDASLEESSVVRMTLEEAAESESRTWIDGRYQWNPGLE